MTLDISFHLLMLMVATATPSKGIQDSHWEVVEETHCFLHCQMRQWVLESKAAHMQSGPSHSWAGCNLEHTFKVPHRARLWVLNDDEPAMFDLMPSYIKTKKELRQ